MSKLQHILAVQIDDPDFNGYRECNFSEVLSNAIPWIGPRPYLEDLDPEAHPRPDGQVILQVIPYIVLTHADEVMAYVRPAAGNEARLHGKVSIGFGGHVDLEDVMHENSIVNLEKTISIAAMREVEEEVGLAVTNSQIAWKGLIVRRDGPVDRVHLGFVGEVALTDDQRSRIKQTEEIGETRFLGLSMIDEVFRDYEIEAWTKAIVEAQ